MTENQIAYLVYFTSYFGAVPQKTEEKKTEETQKGCWY